MISAGLQDFRPDSFGRPTGDTGQQFVKLGEVDQPPEDRNLRRGFQGILNIETDPLCLAQRAQFP
jgi:hypothetical protein